MKRWMSGYVATGLIVVLLLASQGALATSAQDTSDDAQATEIADLQTRVAALETQLAQESGEREPSGSSDLQTRVAGAGGEPGGTPTSSTAAGPVLFEANAETGFADWTEGYFGGFENQFRDEDGILVADPGGYTLLYAPYLTTTPDYILEAEIRLTTPGPGTPEAFGGTIAGLGARLGDWREGIRTGYTATTKGDNAGIDTDVIDSLAVISDLPTAGLPDVNDGEWHVYRFEVLGSQLRFLIDGVLILQVTDMQFTGVGFEGRVAIVTSLGPLEVRAFRVIAWS